MAWAESQGLDGKAWRTTFSWVCSPPPLTEEAVPWTLIMASSGFGCSPHSGCFSLFRNAQKAPQGMAWQTSDLSCQALGWSAFWETRPALKEGGFFPLGPFGVCVCVFVGGGRPTSAPRLAADTHPQQRRAAELLRSLLSPPEIAPSSFN